MWRRTSQGTLDVRFGTHTFCDLPSAAAATAATLDRLIAEVTVPSG
jgi:hypothetical protein